MVYDIYGNPIEAGGGNDGFSYVFDQNNILSISNPTAMMLTFPAVYDAYDSLLASVEHEKNLLGYGTNSSGGQDQGLPIYEYVIPNPISKVYEQHPGWSIRPAPKVCLTSGIHGDERTAVVALFNVVKALVTGSDSVSQTLRNAAQYRIVPIINPGGYNDKTRFNRHGVNLNRNFSYRWDAPGAQAPGSAPYSEYESKALKAWCDEQAPDTLFMIDFHNFEVSENTASYFYLFADIESWKNGFSVVCRGMRNHYLEQNIDLGEYSFFQQGNLVAGIASEFLQVHGVPAGGVETPNDLYNPNNNQWVKPSADLQGSFINYLLHNYRFPAD